MRHWPLGPTHTSKLNKPPSGDCLEAALGACAADGAALTANVSAPAATDAVINRRYIPHSHLVDISEMDWSAVHPIGTDS
jgi:hypothetical protein